MSELFYPDVVLYLCQFLLATTLAYIVGNVFVCITDKDVINNIATKPFEYIFKSFFWGYVVVVTIFALVWAKGNSVMWISLLLCVLLGFWNKKGRCAKIKLNHLQLKYFLFSLPIFLAVFGVFYYVSFIRTGGLIWCDHTFYGNVSAHLASNHIETSNVFSTSLQARPYHWGEFWFTTMFGMLFKSNYTYTLLTTTYPFLLSTLIIGAYTLANKYIKQWWLAAAFALCLPFAVPLTNLIIEWAVPMLAIQKYVIIYLFFVLFLLYYQTKEYSNAFITILLLVPFFSTVAPFVLTFVCILAIFNISQNEKKWITNVITNRYVILAVSVFVLYVLFYFIQRFFPNESIAAKRQLITQGNPIKEFLFFVIKRSARGLILLPSIIAVWWSSKKIKNEYNKLSIAVLLGLIVSAMVAGGLRFVILDGGQATANCYTFLVVMCWYAVLLVSTQLPKLTQMIVIVSFVFFYAAYTLINKVSFGGTGTMYLKRETELTDSEISSLKLIKSEISSDENFKFGYFRNYEREDNKNTHRTRLRMYYPFDIMPHFTSNGYYAPICLSAIDIPIETEPIFNERHLSVLLNYMALQPDSTPQDEQILNFINEHNIGYFVVENEAVLPNYLQGKVDSLASYRGDVLYKYKSNN